MNTDQPQYYGQPFYQEEDQQQQQSNIVSCKILLCGTGSVAMIKIPKIILGLSQHTTKLAIRLKNQEGVKYVLIKYEVKLICTKSACEFISVEDLKDKTGVQIFLDGDEFSMWSAKGDPVGHIELRKWADVLVIAPLTSNTLSKIANGICDNLLTCVVKAWDFNKPFIIAPAMNTLMWKHKYTQKHLKEIKEGLNAECVDPIEKILACNEKGIGALADVVDIIKVVEKKYVERIFDFKKFDIEVFQ